MAGMGQGRASENGVLLGEAPQQATKEAVVAYILALGVAEGFCPRCHHPNTERSLLGPVPC